jgi:transposase
MDANIRAFAYFGGSVRLLISDNSKISVIKACFYEPHVNRSAAELAAHCGAAVLVARPYRPRDKAKVEACVGIVERWLLGRLLHRVWHGLGELNAAIADLLRRLNDEWVMRRFGRTRRARFKELDAPLLSHCWPNPISWRNCAVKASRSIIMLKSKSIFTRCPNAKRPPRSKCG